MEEPTGIDYYIFDMLKPGKPIWLRTLKSATPEKYRDGVERRVKQLLDGGHIQEVRKGKYVLTVGKKGG